MELMQASSQWASRPADERFVSLLDMHSSLVEQRKQSKAIVVPSRSLRCEAREDGRGLELIGPNGNAFFPTHHAFGQLAYRAGAPAAYLRGLPSPLAADCINYGLYTRPVEDIGVLLYKNGAPLVRAVTGPAYGRIWNAEVAKALIDHVGDGVSGRFKVPGEFGQDVVVTKDNTTLYAGDRDMFVFLADEKNRIDVPNRRGGRSGSLARGFFVWNSEVGSCRFGVKAFLFDYVCCNRIVWGAEGVEEISIRHTSGAPGRFLDEIQPALEAYMDGSTTSIRAALAAAQTTKLPDVAKFLQDKFGAKSAERIQAAHLADEQRPIESLWDAATGATAYARTIEWQDDRVEVETKAGDLLKLAVA